MPSDVRSNLNGFLGLPEQENLRQTFFFYSCWCMVGSGGDSMSFDIPTPFDDWEEPFYSIIEVDGHKVFLAQDENCFMWADATDPVEEDMIIDLIVNSVWTPYAVMALCETEDIFCGMIYMRFRINL